MNYIKNQILQNNAIEAWTMAIQHLTLPIALPVYLMCIREICLMIYGFMLR